MSEIIRCAIHPAIGIARVGNSPTAFFVGPQIPGEWPTPPGGFKDGGEPDRGIPPRVKRQAAEFRVYGLDAQGGVVRELTSKDAAISWTLHLANRKAEWDAFEGTRGEERSPFDDDRGPRKQWRNARIEDRASLVIDPGPRTLSRPGAGVTFDGGRFRGIPVFLGEAHMTDEGRLHVLGGYGRSGRSNEDAPIVSYANNDHWFDDVSDGFVRATVKIGGKELPVDNAWVIVAPPDFAPAIQNVVTAWDVAFDVAVRHFKLALPAKPSFMEHVFPLLQRLDQLRWVRKSGKPDLALGDLSVLSSSLEGAKKVRTEIFERFRNPNLKKTDPAAKAQANARYLPALSGDDGDAANGAPEKWLAVTPTQYEILRRWAVGDFDPDWVAPPKRAPGGISPEGLDRAALEACSGGAFYPGIEAGWLLRNPQSYVAPFRLSERFKPGDLTKRMACPWQADFFECKDHWWPAQRPDDVMVRQDYDRIHRIDDERSSLAPDDPRARTLAAERERLVTLRRPWARGLPPRSLEGDRAMVDRWAQHGFVVRKTTSETFLVDDEPVALEIERDPHDGLSWGEYFHILMNIESHPHFRAKARELALGFFNAANFDADPFYAPFAYSEEAFLERLARIYEGLEVGMAQDSRMDTGVLKLPVIVGFDGDTPMKKLKRFEVGRFSDRAVKERIKQRAPFNLVDGAWLRGIQAVGVSDRVQAALFEIWDDETGNGTPEKNHSNVYDVLLKSVGIYLPAATSRQFLEEGLLDAAFIQPVLQLCVSLHPDEFFPELLGMTLYIEWESTPTMVPAVRHLKGRGFDPHFYALHVAIDNVSTGHAAKARDAIREYLAQAAQSGADVQGLWARIWRGYIAWATAGDLGTELLEHQMALDGKRVNLAYPLRLAEEHVQAAALAKRLLEQSDPPTRYVALRLSSETLQALHAASATSLPQATIRLLVRDLNVILQGDSIHEPARFDGIRLGDDTRELLARDVEGEDVVRLNRLLLRDAFAPAIADVTEVEPVWFPDLEAFHRKRVVEIVRRKVEIAKPLHEDVGLADLFDDPDELLSQLVARGFFNPERPRASRFLDLLQFKGPMYKVFSATEIEAILDWIEAMRPSSAPVPTPGDDPRVTAQRVLTWLRANAARGKEVVRHQSLELPTEGGAPRSLVDWFDDPPGLMAALVRASWVVSGKPSESRFYRWFVSGRMSALGPEVANLVRRWIASGALVPKEEAEPAPQEVAAPAALLPDALDAIGRSAPVLEMASRAGGRFAPLSPSGVAIPEGELRADAFFHRRKLIGMGAVH